MFNIVFISTIQPVCIIMQISSGNSDRSESKQIIAGVKSHGERTTDWLFKAPMYFKLHDRSVRNLNHCIHTALASWITKQDLLNYSCVID